ncbi:glycogen phosphorylase, partial [Mesorhizobium sp. M7A.F.Ca.US.006.04.2.1]|uniref:glycogen/starch/alpha-glucan phosphorylase n=1 Tax=Mesorhizobium sp. M7A.F.Ca.US.006.04.2.1 TaxID=2496696 RepID=UPI000FD4A122
MTSAMTSEPLPPLLENPDPKTLAREVLVALKYRVGKDTTVATQYDWLTASIKVVRDRIVDRWMQATKEAYDQKEKRVYYLSLEFLIGRLMRDAFSNLGLMDNMREALSSLGVDLDLIAALEPDAALGNGGLGRLSACFLDSMATVDIPAHGYGIRYANGMFRPEIPDGW